MFDRLIAPKSWVKLYMVANDAPPALAALLGQRGWALESPASDYWTVIFPVTEFGHPWIRGFIIHSRFLKPSKRPFVGAEAIIATYRPTTVEDLSVGQRVLVGHLYSDQPQASRFSGKIGLLAALPPYGTPLVRFFDTAAFGFLDIPCPAESLHIVTTAQQVAAG